jgi:1,4-alpha-glucan branching enzyme
MKNFGAVVFGFILSIFSSQLNAQLLSVDVPFPTDASTVVITADASKGSRGLLNHTASDVYVHTGVTTNLSTNSTDWKYVKFNQNFTLPNAALQATSLGNNRWSFTIANIRAYYGVPAGETILKINILFRSGDGSKKLANIDGSDMYIQIYQAGAFAAKFVTPAMQPMFNPIPEPIASTVTSVPFTAVANRSANLTVRFNGTSVATAASNTTVSGTASVTTTCEQNLTLEAVETSTARDTVAWFRAPASYPTGARPAGVREGITYQNNNTEAVFIINAPGKQRVSIIGDFNNWQQTCAGQMTKDGNFFWARITGITPGQYYRYQYIVDDTIRIADPYTELVLDPFNDKFIPATTFPNMPAYPEGKTTGGIVGVIRSGETFNWTDQAYQRPNKYNLNVYELLIRDFSAAQTYQQLRDTLGYLKRLGINCIELMPVNEFDGNNSWGYNPSYYFALDKAYGTKQAFKEFINDAHRLGIAVVIDAVLNHATGQSPLAAMWWNKAASQPTNDNPYMYPLGQHPFNVYNDLKHTETIVKNLTKRFIEYWLTEYKLDGFRWDLSKGFTTQFYSDVNLWGQYNQGRVDIWKDYNGYMQTNFPGSYCILEHLGADDEEYELAANGMLLWGKMTQNFAENTLGFSNSNAIVSRAYWMYRGVWTNNGDPGRVSFIRDKPGLISYAESHDEERIMYTTRNNTTNVWNLQTALARTEAMTAVLFSIPGPKMIWQFGEVGYDFSINQCENNTISGTCRTSPKPVRWDYWTNPSPNWRRRLYDANAAMMNLRLQRPNAFNSNTIVDNTSDLGPTLVKKVVINHSTLKMVTVANFSLNQVTTSITFPTAGMYYDYTRGGEFMAFGSPQNIILNPGEYRVLIDQNISGGLVTNVENPLTSDQKFSLMVYPNPLQKASTIRYELTNSGNVNFRLLNIQGQQLYSKNLGFQLKGVQVSNMESLGMKMDILPAGTYFLQLNIGNQQLTQKVVVQ